jgi:hypothetical protein
MVVKITWAYGIWSPQASQHVDTYANNNNNNNNQNIMKLVHFFFHEYKINLSGNAKALEKFSSIKKRSKMKLLS